MIIPPRTQSTEAPDQVRRAGKPSRLYTLVIKTTLRSDFLYWAATKLALNLLVMTVLGTPVEDFQTASAEEQARALEVMQHILPISQREIGIWNDATIGPSLPRYDLENIHVPTLLISVEDDLYGTGRGARYSADHIPSACFVGFKTGGHLLLGHWTEARAEVTGSLSSTVKLLRNSVWRQHKWPCLG
jgi:pimeloyl-ACP methyl ester carboxylesterase